VRGSVQRSPVPRDQAFVQDRGRVLSGGPVRLSGAPHRQTAPVPVAGEGVTGLRVQVHLGLGGGLLDLLCRGVGLPHLVVPAGEPLNAAGASRAAASSSAGARSTTLT